MNANFNNMFASILTLLLIIWVVKEVVIVLKHKVSVFRKWLIRVGGRLNYKKSTYCKSTKLPYNIVRHNLGYYGEYLTYLYLKSFENKGAKFLFNVYVPKGDGKTTEIDVLMICYNGIFVFESKNYSGWIFGDESKTMWYQILPVGRGVSNKESFYNPIKQNRKHVEHIKLLLDITVPVWSIVVFSDRCSFKNVLLENNDVSVIHRSEAYSLVSDIIANSSRTVLSEIEIDKIYKKLYPYSQVDGKTRIEHTFSLNPTLLPEPVSDNKNDNDSENKTLICPSCGGTLVIRTAKKGINAGNQFYGCSNYPKCRYTRNIEL